MKKNKGLVAAGFTLVELLVVISIIGVLASIGLVAFNSSQARGRDAQRKSDLKQMSSALELFYSDYGKYPSGSAAGKIQACPYSPVAGTGEDCDWGTEEFTDGQTTYFRVLPADKISGRFYFYRTVAVGSVANSGFQIYARLENLQDSSIIVTDVDCGTGIDCNFAVTSPNTVP